jgi:hypothetical protein
VDFSLKWATFVDGKIEIDCLIRSTANGFLLFILPGCRDYNDRSKAIHVYEYVPPEAIWSNEIQTQDQTLRMQGA